eukprot:TRINITY_DN12558_c12_g4_i1.p1 TRINITY_DN12558_c12_g4~~TRINITY_DN12558_c12_g4_i1.p1  ORF type:complete len:758 (+),score=239.04 TRINITY_DN12558_c12_g4_i1:194-2275(+)
MDTNEDKTAASAPDATAPDQVAKKAKPDDNDGSVKPEPTAMDAETTKQSNGKRTASEREPKQEPEEESEDDDDKPLVAKRKPAKKSPTKKAAPKKTAAKKKAPAKNGKATKDEKDENGKGEPKAKRKKEEPEEEIHKWWEEEELPDGQKWRKLSHRGPYFAPPYEPLPKTVHMLYDGKPFPLEPAAEEVAGFYAMMLTRDYVKKQTFNDNFFSEWRTTMTKEEKAQIKDLSKCDFTLIEAHYKARAEARKAASKEEKALRKEADNKIKEEYGFALMDGHRLPLGNFKIEPPGLFQGRGEHPKMGMLKRRIQPEDIIINCSADAKVPDPPEGHKWKEVRHDNRVTWVASWKENVQGQNKYIMFSPETHIKGRNDWKKYETARRLKLHVDKIRSDYTKDLKSKLMFERQRATALYFIDKLALRAGGEKDADEEADTVGCCSLRVEHLKLLADDELEFDFLGKDSIRYYNKVKVDYQVWKNVGHFQKQKEPGDDLFDRLRTAQLNEYLQSLMEGLTAKVFRTYNASTTLQDQLKTTPASGVVDEKILAYQRANRAVAVLCNHQRAAPKTHDAQVERLNEALEKIRTELRDTKAERKELKKDAKRNGPSAKDIKKLESLKKKIERLELRLQKKEIAKVDKIENKTIALGTSKLNYLDPRISVAWCKRFDVPVEKVYNRTQRKKFRWAMEMAEADFVF